MRPIALCFTLLLVSAQPALAVGDDTSEPPAPTETSTDCKDGQVWDEETETCIDAESSNLTDEMRYRAVRELAYAGRYASALIVLDAMPATSDATLTYRGFIARKQGDWPRALDLYQQALDINPGNILARSYLGQGHALRGETPQAQAQLAAIRAYGGAGTWAEAALARALATGTASDY